MERRELLAAGAGAFALGLGGCLGGGNPDATLGEPDRPFDSEDVPYPAWGQRIPDVTLPAPLEDREIALRGVETPVLLTFFYSHCPDVCPRLVSALRSVQTHAGNNGYGDAVTFLPITFDPERDDAARLRAYGEQMNVDLDAGNWHFLRPRSVERAKGVVEERFGLVFEREDLSDGGDHEGHEGYGFVHMGLTLLVNAGGYVERAYQTSSPDADTIVADLDRVR